jgi:predicted transposase YdaD
MFGLSKLKQTKVYQEARQEGEVLLILRQLSRRIGAVSSETQSQIQQSSIPVFIDMCGKGSMA